MSTKSSTRTAIWPSLLYRDANAAVAFLVEAFGFEESAVYRSCDGAVVIMREMRDEQEYESRGFTARDPEGVIWSFGTYAGAGSGDV
jgi:uncharacterized glyoxalase superfamily protein PhnB